MPALVQMSDLSKFDVYDRNCHFSLGCFEILRQKQVGGKYHTAKGEA
jgi:hypothetical protein